MHEYKKILVATDLSDPAVPAVLHGSSLARRLGSKIVLVYVMEDRIPGWLSETDVGEIMERHREQAKQALADCAAEHLVGNEVETVVLEGPPHSEILKLAGERGVDMIVIGMHGHGYLTHALAGNTTERVLHHAPCPVFVVSRTD